MGLARRLGLIVLSAALYAAAFPPLAWSWCAWIALAPLLLALRGATVGGAAALGALWGVVAAQGVGTWFVYGVASYYDRPLALGVLFFAGVALLLAAPFFAAFAAAVAWLERRRGKPVPVLWVAMLWVALELARARFLVGNPWALLGYSQTAHARLIQIADLTGVYGISFVLAAAGAAGAGLLDRRLVPGARLGRVAVAAALAGSVVGYGTWIVDQPRTEGRPLRVAVVQGNVDAGSQWRRDRHGSNLTTYLVLSQEVLARARPDLVVWPESAVTFFIEEEPAYRMAIRHLFASAGAHLLLGGPAVAEREPTARFTNAAYLLAPGGTLVDRYDKVHLVPFAEYFPLARFEALRRRFARVRVFTPGARLAPLAHPAGPIGTVICFEAMYPELVAAEVRAGARLLVNLTNDAWMDRTSFARQHLEIARLRAVESRRWLVRAAATGISAVIDPRGRTVAELPAVTAATAVADVQLLQATTVYTRLGDVFALACALGSGLVLAGVALAHRRPE